MDLLPFQDAAASQIAKRFATYVTDPLMIDRTRTIPFFQLLVSITGSGKTLMLADAVAQMRTCVPREPVVLWLSKGRVVVWQTFANLTVGKYAANLKGFTIKPLLELAPSHIEDASSPLLLIATVGKFARQDDDGNDRKVFQVQLDLADASLWNLLKHRRLPNGERRPLIVIYDEGQNLTDLQTGRLMELAPDALISASATPSVPEAMERVLARLRDDKGWTKDDFRTTVSSPAVVLSGLVKQRLSLGGYVTPMETAIDALLADMKEATSAAAALDEPFAPKAIYVSTTNTVDGVSILEDADRPFEERRARPIVIWRHLVASGIDPAKIAVYCQVTFGKRTVPPREFRLFGDGDRDYDRFVESNFEHIIFNLSLQEGWDDPTCGFAYIDKEMASSRQITQVIGRTLRQPGGNHFSDPILNTAHFYIRSDEKGAFEDILSSIQTQLADEHPAIELTIRPTNQRAGGFREQPSRQRLVPTTSIYSGPARAPIAAIVAKLIDFNGGGSSTEGHGARMQVLQEIGARGNSTYEWVEVDHSNRVTARSIFRRELQRLFPGGLRRAGGPVNLVDIEDHRFDALVEINSPAATHVRQIAAEAVNAFIDHSRLLQNDDDPPYAVGPIALNPANAVPFSNALHTQYSGLNKLELKIALALDKTQRVWCRNPQQSGYFIPLLDRGSTATFWPDFLVWVGQIVVAVDTKGGHLLTEDSGRKLFTIDGTGDRPRILLRLISEGQWTSALSGQIGQHGKDGFTVWHWAAGKLQSISCPDAKGAVEAALSHLQ